MDFNTWWNIKVKKHNNTNQVQSYKIDRKIGRQNISEGLSISDNPERHR